MPATHPSASPYLFSVAVRYLTVALATACLFATANPLAAQFAPQPGQQNFQNRNVGFGQGNNAAVGTTGTTTGAGGAASADFDSLIDLIQSTVAVDTWAETGGGEAEIRPFPTGVMVDTAGVLTELKVATPSNELANRRATGLSIARQGEQNDEAPMTNDQLRADHSSFVIPHSSDPRRAAALRYISLPRLEREIIRRQNAHQPLDEPMLTLAGLQRVEFVFVYPESGDVVIAGPAGDWEIDPVGRIVSTDTGQPVVRLDDLLTLMRRAQLAPESFFGCMINPRQEALARTQQFLDKSARRPLDPNRRDQWLETIRDTLGHQDVEIFGIDPASRVARVLVEADVHMKLIGMGLANGVPGVESYLDSVVAAQRAGASPPPAMSVLRWWFALKYDAIRTSPAGDAFELVGQGTAVLSENELLAAQGRRVHTGQSDPLNKQFADSFTDHFATLADKYPVYGELHNIFDLAMAVAIIYTEDLPQKAGWQPTRLVDAEKLRLPQWPVPRVVETVANYVEANRRQLIAGVSGGVMIATADVLAKDRDVTPSGDVVTLKEKAPPRGATTWWWDAP